MTKLSNFYPMKKLFFLLIPVLLGIFLFSNCKKSKLVIDPGFSEHITAFTSGEISVASYIRIELSQEVEDAAENNTEVKEDLFDFSPNIKGKAYWIDKKTIEFRPDNWLTAGKSYSGEFFLKKIKKVDSKFKVFKFEFSTIKQSFSVSIDGYEPYQIENLRNNKISCFVLTADMVAEKEIQKIITAIQDGRNLPVTLVQAENNKYSFQIDSIIRGEKESKVNISWDGNPIGVNDKSSESLIIHSIFDFLVIEAKPYQEPNQHIEIRFSDPLDKNQNLNG